MRQDAVPAFTLLVIALAACGGKIAEDPGNLGEPGSRSTSPSPSSPVLPAPTTASAPSELSVEAVCSTICDRNGRCGADPGGCAERCTSSLTVGACAPSADASLRCWVANLEPWLLGASTRVRGRLLHLHTLRRDRIAAVLSMS
jgi:hypothetical protein